MVNENDDDDGGDDDDDFDGGDNEDAEDDIDTIKVGGCNEEHGNHASWVLVSPHCLCPVSSPG